AFPAAAGPQGHLHRLQRRRANVRRRYSRATQRRQGVLVRIRRLDGRRERVSEVVGRLDSRISKLDATIEIVSERLTKTQQQLDVLQAQLDRLTQRLRNRTQVFLRRAVAEYEAGPTAYIDGMLSSQSFGAIVSNSNYFNSVLRSDANLVEQIKTLKTQTTAT